MNFDTAKKIVDFAFKLPSDNGKIDFGFFGGEPLLEFELMKKIVDYIREKNEEHPIKCNLSITTNGTLLSEEILGFLQYHDFNLCISLDGNMEINDKNRLYSDGSSTFKDVMNNIDLALRYLPDTQVNAVISPDTIESMPETIRFFIENGMKKIHFNLNICSEWNLETLKKVEEKYKQLSKIYIDNYENGNEIALNIFDNKIIVMLKGGYSEEDKCGMGKTEWGFSPSGNIYPCERLIGEDDDRGLCMGNISNNRSNIKPPEINKESKTKIICDKCIYNQYCMNWCGCTNHHLTGSFTEIDPFFCVNEQIMIKNSVDILSSLSQNDLFIDHYLKYVTEGHHGL